MFKQEVIAETYKEANSQVNIAVQLVRKAYSRNERVRSNCSGKANKLLLSPRRLAAVKKSCLWHTPSMTRTEGEGCLEAI